MERSLMFDMLKATRFSALLQGSTLHCPSRGYHIQRNYQFMSLEWNLHCLLIFKKLWKVDMRFYI